MLADLPTHCAVGTKRNAKGHTTSWIGYKLHIDVADGDFPVSCLLTSASLHDSQVAIPLASMTAARVTNLYDLMDSADDAPEIKAKSRALGHVPIIAPHPRSIAGGKAALEAELRARRYAGFKPAEAHRFSERRADERVNARLKDEFGGRTVRVRGHAKVFCHIMFGIVALTVDQLLRLVT
jgi:Transposase DDE domain